MITREILKEIILSQREFLDRTEQGTLREKGKEIIIESSFALIITGIRRAGKSTFLNQLLKKYKGGYYLNLEDPRLDGFELSDFNKAEAIMKELYGENKIYFFDEIQNVLGWERFIRYLVDKKEKAVITGSNASMLSRELGTKLTGRHLKAEIFPFSFSEFLDAKKADPSIKYFEDYFYKGGFPEYIKEENPAIHQELLADVIMRDIAARLGIRNISTLNKVAIFLASNVGKEFSYNSIKNMFNIKSVQSVIDYISYFENAYLIFTMPRFSYSYKQQQVNPKKAYSIDNGFSYNNSASFSKDTGKMLENIVFLGLRKKFKDIFYFKEKNECDFVVKEKDKIIKAIQVCFEINKENNHREIIGLVSALKEFNLKEGLILTYNQDDKFLVEGKKITVKPIWKWLLDKK
jgi:uncharacterized protein